MDWGTGIFTRNCKKCKEIKPEVIYSMRTDFINCTTYIYMSTELFKEREEKRQKGFRTIYDYTMGILWLGAGLFFLLNKYLVKGFAFDSLTSSLFGITCLCYGVFRLYRGMAAKK